MPAAILVVDYEESIRRLVVGALEGAGYRVFLAQSAADALAVVRNRKVDLLLCNVAMPDLSGIVLSLRAQELRPGLRVLLTTGHPMGERIPPASAAGTRLMERTFRPDVLLSEVEKILGRE